MRILIYGAGVIGQIYAGRLARAGHAVTLLARAGSVTATTLAERGIALSAGGQAWRGRLPVVSEVPGGEDTPDAILVCVRRDQLAAALPAIARAPARQVVFLLNQCTGLADVRHQVGAGRTLLGFPGVAGRRMAGGVIEYADIRRQHTTLERRDGEETAIADAIRGAGFLVDLCDDMDSWLKTHAVFIAAVGAAILAAGGDSAVLAADRARVGAMVTAVGEGFAALRRSGVRVIPAPLRVIFTTVPRPFAVRYWQAQLRGPVGTLAIAPHIRATSGTEFRALAADVRELTGGRAPLLDRLLAGAGSGGLARGRRGRRARHRA